MKGIIMTSKDTPTKKSITKIVITGGPCAGKSTCMSFLVERLQELGYGVLVVNETATELMGAGCAPSKNIDLYDFESHLLSLQINKENLYVSLAESIEQDKVVILFDRGVLDIRAYIPNEMWESILEEQNLSLVKLRDGRYDAVIHLRTAALGAAKFYTCANNSTRVETETHAIAIDNKTLESWIGHPHLSVIDNSTDFEHKVKRVLEVVLHTLGEPTPLEIEKKYLIASGFDYRTIPTTYHISDIEQVYITGGYRIRKRGEKGSFVYTKTYKQDTDDPLVRIETEEMISGRMYRELLAMRLPHIKPLHKKRVCFIYKEQYFELDIFNDHDLIFLEIELTEQQQNVLLPKWIPVIREVTDNPAYRNAEIAKR